MPLRSCYLVFIAVLTVLAGIARAETAAATQPATRPVTTTQAAPLDPKVEAILERLERRKVETLEANVIYSKTQPILESEQKFIGVLRFKHHKPNPKFLIRFDRLVHDGMLINKKEWHAFDGRWYTEAREETQTIMKREIAREGEAVDAFKVGKGPFPLPFGQQKQEILDNFTVELVPPDKDDPKNTDHLACTPLPGTELAKRYGKVHFYIDRKLDLPVRVETVQKDKGTKLTVRFAKIEVNKKLSDKDLELPSLKGYGEPRIERLPPESEPLPRIEMPKQ